MKRLSLCLLLLFALVSLGACQQEPAIQETEVIRLNDPPVQTPDTTVNETEEIAREIAPGLELEGMFQYFADAPNFRDCSTGRRFPVEMSGQYIELERTYLNSGIELGSELKVSLRGRYLERDGMELNSREIKLIVDIFNHISDDQDCTPTHHVELLNTYWRLVELHGAVLRASANQKEPHMILQTKDQRLKGNGGCNTFFGTYALEGEQLSFSAMGSTMMACPAGMETEQSFLLALAETDRAVVSGQFLELFKDDQQLARFEAMYF